MPWAAGNFSRYYGATGWASDLANNIYILASRHDTHDQDLAGGIDACLTRDNQSKPTADFLPASNNAYNLGSASFLWKRIFGTLYSDAIRYDTTPAEIEAGVTPVNYYELESTPERYQTNTTPGTTVMDTGWANAIAVNKAGGRRVQGRMTTYKLNNALSIDPFLNDVDLGGAILDFSGLTLGTAVNSAAIALVSSTAASSSNVNAMISRAVRNGYIKGGNAASVFAINTGSSDNTKANYFFGFEKLGVYNFKNGISIGTQSFEITFRHMILQPAPGSTGTLVSIQGGGTNYGERVTFFDVGFQGADLAADIEYGNTSVFFINCSFDYPGNQMIKVRNGGNVYCIGCHFESNLDANYWFDVSDANSYLQISHSFLALTGNKTSFPIGNCASSCVTCGIEIIDSKFATGNSYALDYLIGGTGRTVIRNLQRYGTSTPIVNSQNDNQIWNWTFSSASVNEYSLTGTAAPARDTTTGHGDSNSLKFNPGAGQTSVMAIIVPCQAGQLPVIGFYYKSSGISVGNTWTCVMSFFNATSAGAQDQSILSGAVNVATTTDAASFTQFRAQPQTAAPPGTRWVQVAISLGAAGARTLWIDDVVMSVS